MINSVITISGYQVTDQPTISITNLEQLVTLRDRLNQIIAEFGKPKDEGEYISATLGRKIANSRGIQMHDNTIMSACQRGVIPSARKNGGRWEFLASDFETYMRKFTQHRKIKEQESVTQRELELATQSEQRYQEMRADPSKAIPFEEYQRMLQAEGLTA